uniref:Urea transporter n=1 Tax=Denticeps clupeoides TaxID=299321 RepID=A0AAY4D010_9TELE
MFSAAGWGMSGQRLGVSTSGAGEADSLQYKPFILQLLEWSLRGVSQVILANNPVSGALILCALAMDSPWQALLGTMGLLSSTLTAVIIGQDSAEITSGDHGFNGMLVALLMGIFSSAGDWYGWLLLPACLGGATCTFFHSGLARVFKPWDLPVSVFPFNTIILLYLACTGPTNPYFPHYDFTQPVAKESLNFTHLDTTQLLCAVPLGVGQIYATKLLSSSLLILVAVFLFSPILCIHALVGSAVGTLAGLSVVVHHTSLFTGLSGFNGALGCMVVGGLCFRLSWTTHLFSIAAAFLSSYLDIALSNTLAKVGLPACSWGSTLTITLMLVLSASHLSSYRIPCSQNGPPEHNLQLFTHGVVAEEDSTDV